MKHSMQGISFSREEFDRNSLPDKGDNKTEHSMQGISFSREEFDRNSLPDKGDNKTEHSMQGISFSDRNLIEALPLLKEKIK